MNAAELAANPMLSQYVVHDLNADPILPFPDEFDGRELDAAIGPISWTPLAEGVRRTIDRLRDAPG